MASSHALRVASHRNKLSSILRRDDQVSLDGSSLDTLKLVAIARYAELWQRLYCGRDLTTGLGSYGKSASVDRLPEDVAYKVDQSVQFLNEELARGRSVYGMHLCQQYSNILSETN
jgi:hypothetical protein